MQETEFFFSFNAKKIHQMKRKRKRNLEQNKKEQTHNKTYAAG